MLRTLTIQGFKKFTDQSFTLAPLTVLTGMNGAGKTSFLQALLLMREATGRMGEIVHLNGLYDLALGTFGDIQNWEIASDLRFSLTNSDGEEFLWELKGDHLESLYAKVAVAPNLPPLAFAKNGRYFQYLSAERFGPRTAFESSALPPELLEVGTRGEFSAQVLDTLDTHPIDEARRAPKGDSDVGPLLKFEVERWLSQIVRPIQIDTESLATKMSTTLKYRTPNGEWVRATNMGFGVTYTLPIVIAGLLLRPGGLLVVENPEAHLHPAGQSNIGRFLAVVAAAGVQVVIETHSDHVLNGVRLAIGETRSLAAEDAITYFFGDGDTAPTELKFTARGGIDDWPAGFFDQYQLDVAALTRVRRPR